MSWWDIKASQLSSQTRTTESRKEETYDEATVKRAIICTREDVVMLVSLLSSSNALVSRVGNLLIFVLFMLGAILFTLIIT